MSNGTPTLPPEEARRHSRRKSSIQCAVVENNSQLQGFKDQFLSEFLDDYLPKLVPILDQVGDIG